MTVRGRACMRVCAFMNWFINYVMMESMKYIITSACLSVFLYLPIYIRTHTHTHTYKHVCVCVFGCSPRGGGGGGGGALRYRGGPHLSYVFREKKGSFFVRDFVKEGYFFVPRCEVWGLKSPYNPRNIRGSDAE